MEWLTNMSVSMYAVHHEFAQRFFMYVSILTGPCRLSALQVKPKLLAVTFGIPNVINMESLHKQKMKVNDLGPRSLPATASLTCKSNVFYNAGVSSVLSLGTFTCRPQIYTSTQISSILVFLMKVQQLC
jgi:hypothetical protein